MKRFIGILALTILGAAAQPSAALADARFYVRVAPPAPLVEVRGWAPSPAHVWVAGHYRWAGNTYGWVGGRWELPPRYHSAWVDGHWAAAPGHGWSWVDGHWR